MSYDLDALARGTERLLAKTPTRALNSIAAELGVDRHTIAQALRRTRGRSYSEIQAEMVFQILDRVWAEGRLISWKELAGTMGCGYSTLWRWVARHEAARKILWRRRVTTLSQNSPE